jgi:hypothetical protein
MILLLLLLLIIATIIEGTMTTLPLVLICILCLTIVTRNIFVFLASFFVGLFLDIFALRPLGETSLFLLFFVLLLLLYQRKYEINSYPFVLLASFAGSFLFLTIFGYQDVFVQSSLSAMVAFVLFAVVRFVEKKGSSAPMTH